MVELTIGELMLVILAASITALVAGWFLGIFTFPWYLFARARRDPLIDNSNKNQIDAPIAQLATHAGDFTKMYYLTEAQYGLLVVDGDEIAKCFPDMGKDLSEYGMVRPPKKADD